MCCVFLYSLLYADTKYNIMKYKEHTRQDRDKVVENLKQCLSKIPKNMLEAAKT